MIIVKCQGCGAGLKLTDDKAGKHGKRMLGKGWYLLPVVCGVFAWAIAAVAQDPGRMGVPSGKKDIPVPPPFPSGTKITASLPIKCVPNDMRLTFGGRFASFPIGRGDGDAIQVVQVDGWKILGNVPKTGMDTIRCRPVLSADGKYLAAIQGGGPAGTTGVCIMDVKTGKRLWVAWTKNNVTYCGGFCFSPNGRFLAAFTQGPLRRDIFVYDVASGRPIHVFPSKANWGDGPQCAAIAPDGGRLAIGLREGRMQPNNPGLIVMDLKTGAETVETRFTDVSAVAFSPDGKWLAVAGRPRQPGSRVVRLYGPGDQIKDSKGLRTVYSLAFSPDLMRLAAGVNTGVDSRATGTVIVWDVAGGNELMKVGETEKPLELVGFSDEGMLLLGRVREGRSLGEVETGDTVTSFGDPFGRGVTVSGGSRVVTLRELSFEIGEVELPPSAAEPDDRHSPPGPREVGAETFMKAFDEDKADQYKGYRIRGEAVPTKVDLGGQTVHRTKAVIEGVYPVKLSWKARKPAETDGDYRTEATFVCGRYQWYYAGQKWFDNSIGRVVPMLVGKDPTVSVPIAMPDVKDTPAMAAAGAKTKPPTISGETTRPAPSPQADQAMREKKISEALELCGDGVSLGGQAANMATTRAMIRIMRTALNGKSLSMGWPLAAKHVAARYAAVRITARTSEQPALDSIRSVLGKEDSAEKDAGASVTWYKYGWCHFGVADNKVTILRADCDKTAGAGVVATLPPAAGGRVRGTGRGSRRGQAEAPANEILAAPPGPAFVTLDPATRLTRQKQALDLFSVKGRASSTFITPDLETGVRAAKAYFRPGETIDPAIKNQPTLFAAVGQAAKELAGRWGNMEFMIVGCSGPTVQQIQAILGDEESVKVDDEYTFDRQDFVGQNSLVKGDPVKWHCYGWLKFGEARGRLVALRVASADMLAAERRAATTKVTATQPVPGAGVRPAEATAADTNVRILDNPDKIPIQVRVITVAELSRVGKFTAGTKPADPPFQAGALPQSSRVLLIEWTTKDRDSFAKNYRFPSISGDKCHLGNFRGDKTYYPVPALGLDKMEVDFLPIVCVVEGGPGGVIREGFIQGGGVLKMAWPVPAECSQVTFTLPGRRPVRLEFK